MQIFISNGKAVMKKTISIIIPVYNVDKYIEQCLDSIISQSYQKLEIILIDDGSTDQSGVICDKYARLDSRIKVIHQKNGGAASAKNVGLRIATGEYLAFVDSDDYLEQDVYQYMVSMLEKEKADVIQCCFKKVYKNSYIEYNKFAETKEYNDIREYLKRYTFDWTCGLLWDKLYKRKIFDGVLFVEGRKIDDEFFTYQGIMNATKVIRSSKIIYNYRMRKSSVMLSNESQRQIITDKIDYLEQRRVKITKVFPELKVVFDHHYLEMLLALSKEKNINEGQIYRIKSLIKNYFFEKNHIKVKWSFRWQLMKIQYNKYMYMDDNSFEKVDENDGKLYFE